MVTMKMIKVTAYGITTWVHASDLDTMKKAGYSVVVGEPAPVVDPEPVAPVEPEKVAEAKPKSKAKK
jgi:hypothetical protein